MKCMKRREFLLATVGVSGATAVASGQALGQPETASSAATAGRGDETAGPTLAQEDEPDEDNGNGNGTNGAEVVVDVVDYAYEPGTDEPLEIPPGTTVRFVWQSDGHDITIESQPEESDWEGVPSLEDTGFEHTHTFEVEGTYEIFCSPHVGLGQVATIIVDPAAEIDDDDPEAVPPAEREIDPDEIGVPLQKHFIAIATFFGIFLTLVFSFYVLKYGESPHSGSPNRRE